MAVLFGIALLCAANDVRATDGIWNTNASSNWGTPGNWVSSQIADGVGSIADFSQVNLTANRTITINNDPRVVGTLVYGDPTPSHGYSMNSSGGATLTFDNGPSAAQIYQRPTTGGGLTITDVAIYIAGSLNISPGTSQVSIGSGTTIESLAASGTQTINVSGTATITGQISDGASGGKIAVLQSGEGVLNLGNNAAVVNTFSGGVAINSGTVRLADNAASAGTGTITLNGGALEVWRNRTYANALSVTAESSIVRTAAASTLSGALTGTGQTLKIDAGAATGDGGARITLSGSMAGYSGTIALLNGLTRLSASNVGSDNVLWDLRSDGIGGMLTSNNAGAVYLGALQGTANSRIVGDTVSGDATRFVIGALNQDTSYAGEIALWSAGLRDIEIEKVGTGVLALTGEANNYTAATIIRAGVLAASKLSNAGTASSIGASTGDNSAGNLVLDGGTLRFTGASGATNRLFTLGSAGGTLEASGTGVMNFTNNGSVAFEGAGTRTLTLAGTNTGSNTLALALGNEGANQTSVVKSGAGTWVLKGTNTYTGATVISAGTLVVGMDGEGSLGATAVSVENGGTLAGSGPIAGTVSVQSGGTLSPGNSPGLQVTGSQTWFEGGNYNWQIHDATGLAGIGYDSYSITGSLDLSHLDEGAFNVNLWSLSEVGPDVNGNAINFNGLSDYTWTLATTTGGIMTTGLSGPINNYFLINVGAFNGTGGFTNSLGIDGSFSVNIVGNNLVLMYSAVPEPSAAMLLMLGAGLFICLMKRARYLKSERSGKAGGR